MRIAISSALSVALLAALTATPAVAEVKVGVVNMSVLQRSAPQVKAADAKFKAEFQRQEDELKAEVKKLAEDEKRLQREADTMSAQQRATASKDLYTRKTDFELKARQYEEQKQAKYVTLERDVLTQFGKAIEEVAREKGLDLVLRDAAFFSKELDITADVMAKLATMPDATPAESKKKKK